MHRNHLYQKGGDKPFDVDPLRLNRFIDPQMEQYMNPIYGLVLCETGYVPNLYALKKSGLIDSFSKYFAEKISENIVEEDEKMLKFKIAERMILEHAIIVNRTCTKENGSNMMKPTKKIMKMEEVEEDESESESKSKKKKEKKQSITLVDLGRYIAIKYVNKFINPLFVEINEKHRTILINSEYEEITPKEKDDIIKCIKFFNEFIKIGNDDIFNFHLLLFFLWWKVNTNERFNDYYQGIQEIFNIVNRHKENFIEKYPSTILPLVIGIDDDDELYIRDGFKSFEEIVLDSTRVKFKLYQQEYSLHFCNKEFHPPSYADCGETTVRNIINILCFNGFKFDIELLKEKGAIPELIAYYTVFNNFEMQSMTEKTRIFDMELNARDAWSKLLNMHSQYNVNFSSICKKDTKNAYGFDIKGGLAKDGSKPNLLQMLQNLIPGITNWSHLINANIEEVKPEVSVATTGIGNVEIKTSSGLNFIVNLKESHYFVALPNKIENMNYSYLSKYQEDILNILFKKKITKVNYIHVNFTPERLVSLFLSSDIPEIKLGLFELSFTDKYDNDTRRQIQINPNSHFFNNIAEVCGNNERINEYHFLTMRDFKFVRKLPALRVLNLIVTNHKKDTGTIDLSPLSPLKKKKEGGIEEEGGGEGGGGGGDGGGGKEGGGGGEGGGGEGGGGGGEGGGGGVEEEGGIEEIGNNFLYEWENIEEINLKPLKNVHTIGEYFLFKCMNANVMGFEHLTKLTKIGDYFLCMNEYLHITNNTPITVDLSKSPIVSIGDHFLRQCIFIKTVKFNPEPIITSVGEGFLFNCTNLESVDLKCLENIATINNFFMEGCSNLTTVEFPNKFKNLTEIKDNFMSNKIKLKNIDLSCFSNVKKIGKNFLNNSGLEIADLSSLTKLTEIGTNFMANCLKLKEVILPPHIGIKQLLISNNGHLIPKLKQDNASASTSTSAKSMLSSECAAGSNNSKCTIMGGSKRRRSTRKIKKNAKKHTRKYR